MLISEDFAQAIHDFLPVAMRSITKSASEGGRSGWEDVGGLVDIRNAIQEVSMFFSYDSAQYSLPLVLLFVNVFFSFLLLFLIFFSGTCT